MFNQCRYKEAKEDIKGTKVIRIVDRFGNYLGEIREGVIFIFSKASKELYALLNIPPG